MTEAVQDFETDLWLDGDQWLAWWAPQMDYDDWENSRAEASRRLAPQKLSIAQLLTQKAKQLESDT